MRHLKHFSVRVPFDCEYGSYDFVDVKNCLHERRIDYEVKSFGLRGPGKYFYWDKLPNAHVTSFD